MSVRAASARSRDGPAALLWDVDGTLAETERDGHRVAFNIAFESFGLAWHWSAEAYGALLRVTGGRERLLYDMEGRADAPPAGPRREALAGELHRRKNAHYAALVAAQEIRLRPGVAELIDEAAARGVPQAIVTTTSASNVAALLASAFGTRATALFAACVCGEHVQAKKPHPEAHERALGLLGVAPGRALALEDSPAGLAAARAAGVPVVVTRSAYFDAHPMPGALAVGPGLDTRRGWSPAAGASEQADRLGWDDLARWHASASSCD
ncbi:MAG TPA: HAD-IA family hydrolase, partial [Burkholderiaceae bacterium]|nr:HAD-IA family hydrolase [Burkholderiaceae bacterium]